MSAAFLNRGVVAGLAASTTLSAVRRLPATATCLTAVSGTYTNQDLLINSVLCWYFSTGNLCLCKFCNLMDLISSHTVVSARHASNRPNTRRPKHPSWNRQQLIELTKPQHTLKHPTTQFLYQDCPRHREMQRKVGQYHLHAGLPNSYGNIVGPKRVFKNFEKNYTTHILLMLTLHCQWSRSALYCPFVLKRAFLSPKILYCSFKDSLWPLLPFFDNIYCKFLSIFSKTNTETGLMVSLLLGFVPHLPN